MYKTFDIILLSYDKRNEKTSIFLELNYTFSCTFSSRKFFETFQLPLHGEFVSQQKHIDLSLIAKLAKCRFLSAESLILNLDLRAPMWDNTMLRFWIFYCDRGKYFTITYYPDESGYYGLHLIF